MVAACGGTVQATSRERMVRATARGRQRRENGSIVCDERSYCSPTVPTPSDSVAAHGPQPALIAATALSSSDRRSSRKSDKAPGSASASHRGVDVAVAFGVRSDKPWSAQFGS